MTQTWNKILADFVSDTNIDLDDTLEIKTEFVVLKTNLNKMAEVFEKSTLTYIDLVLFATQSEIENLLDAAITLYSKMELYRQSVLN